MTGGSRNNGAPRIDLNVDAGESFGAWRMGDDAAMFASVTSVNVACGYHAGDPATMAATVALAARSGVAIGAHPSYPDLAGFGRRSMQMSGADLQWALVYQVGALDAIARANGARLAHVKPHGALYNDAGVDAGVATAIVTAMRKLPGLRLFVLSGSVLENAAREAGLAVAAEGFCDRAYDARGRLEPRSKSGSVIDDPQAAARQAVGIAVRGEVRASSGETIALRADTLCVHGDTPGAPAIARAVRAALEAEGVAVAAFDR